MAIQGNGLRLKFPLPPQLLCSQLLPPLLSVLPSPAPVFSSLLYILTILHCIFLTLLLICCSLLSHPSWVSVLFLFIIWLLRSKLLLDSKHLQYSQHTQLPLVQLIYIWLLVSHLTLLQSSPLL